MFDLVDGANEHGQFGSSLEFRQWVETYASPTMKEHMQKTPNYIDMFILGTCNSILSKSGRDSWLNLESRFVCEGATAYEVLGIPPTTKGEEFQRRLKANHRSLSLKYHPDKNSSRKEEANLKMQQINHATEILRDKAMRKYYDLFLELFCNKPLFKSGTAEILTENI